MLFLPKCLSHHRGVPALGSWEAKAVYYSLWLTVLKRESKNASLITLFLFSQFDLEPRKLSYGINDVWGQTLVCGEKARQTAELYTNNPPTVLTLSLLALSPPCSLREEERYFLVVVGGQNRVEEELGCSHLHYWPSKSSVGLLASQWTVVMATLESRSPPSFGHCLEYKVPVQLSTSWLKKHIQPDRYRHR